MKKQLIFILMLCLTIASCEKGESMEDTPPVVEDLAFLYQTTNNSITVQIVQSEQNEQISWYNMLIGKIGEELERKATYQDLINDTMTYEFKNLEASTLYEVQVEGTSYAIGGEIIAIGFKEIMTD